MGCTGALGAAHACARALFFSFFSLAADLLPLFHDELAEGSALDVQLGLELGFQLRLGLGSGLPRCRWGQWPRLWLGWYR